MIKKKHTKKVKVNTNYTIIRVMNGAKIPSKYHCKDLLLLWHTNLEDTIYYVYDDIIKKEKLIEILTDINQFNLYMRRMKLDKITKKIIIDYKTDIKLYLMYFINDNYNAITTIEEENKYIKVIVEDE